MKKLNLEYKIKYLKYKKKYLDLKKEISGGKNKTKKKGNTDGTLEIIKKIPFIKPIIPEKLFYCQKEINKLIIKVLLEAKQYIIWFSMLTQFSDKELNNVLYICKKKKIKLYIYHGINPYLNEKSKIFYIENINMHPNFFPFYVNHI